MEIGAGLKCVCRRPYIILVSVAQNTYARVYLCKLLIRYSICDTALICIVSNIQAPDAFLIPMSCSVMFGWWESWAKSI